MAKEHFYNNIVCDFAIPCMLLLLHHNRSETIRNVYDIIGCDPWTVQ